MSFWKKIFGVKESPQPKLAAFAEKAIQGSADCEIDIGGWFALYKTLAKVLINSGMTAQAVVDLVNERLIGVCPKCHTLHPGQGLAMVSLMHEGANIINAPANAYRILEGRCRNLSCSSRDIIIFWKPDEDRDAIARLASMGIVVRPKAAALDDIVTMYTLRHGSLEATKAALKDNPHLVFSKDDSGCTPLHDADRDNAELLLAYKADVNAKSPEGWTPLHFAAANGHKDVVEVLLAHGRPGQCQDQ